MSSSAKKILQVSVKISFSNPIFIYCLIWGVALFLYNLELTTNILGLNKSTIILVISSVFSFFLAYVILEFIIISLNGFIIKVRNNHFYKVNTNSKVENFERIIKKISLIWIFFTLFEIFNFKGIPLISVVFLGQYELDYAAFGLPTLHGLMNSLYLSITCSIFILYQVTKNRKFLYLVVIMFFWPILVMSRALMIWTIIEFFSIYFLFNVVNFRKIFGLLSVVFFVIFLFGYIGDNRGQTKDNESERFTDSFVKSEYRPITDKIPSGFIWVYLYVTTPLNNVVWNIENINPEYNFKYTFRALLPSVIRDDSNKSGGTNNSLELFEEAFNVSSYYANYLKDFGVFGAGVIIFFLQFIVLLIYRSAKKFKIGGMIAYATIFNSIVMSIFFDYFFSLVTIFQVLLGLFINHLLYKKSYV